VVGIVGLVFALFTVGYILGVWTACLVFRQPQPAYEDGVPAALSSVPVVVLRDASRMAERRR
jgi:hypothetical protein